MFVLTVMVFSNVFSRLPYIHPFYHGNLRGPPNATPPEIGLINHWFPLILGVDFPLHRQYPHTAYIGFLHFRYQQIF